MKTQVSISCRAVRERLTRHLKKKGQELKYRGSRRRGHGEYIVVDKTSVVLRNVDIEQLARKLEVIKEWEKIEG